MGWPWCALTSHLHHLPWIPGRDELIAAPSEWPERLWPGSLNVWIAADGYLPEFAARGLPQENLVTLLDELPVVRGVRGSAPLG